MEYMARSVVEVEEEVKGEVIGGKCHESYAHPWIVNSVPLDLYLLSFSSCLLDEAPRSLAL